MVKGEGMKVEKIPWDIEDEEGALGLEVDQLGIFARYHKSIVGYLGGAPTFKALLYDL